MRKEKNEAQLLVFKQVSLQLTPTQQRYIIVAEEKGASSWLVALPIEKHGFSLHKSAFRDALCLRYGWQPSLLPSSCACGQSFSVDHALSCHMGGFHTIHHNENQDLTANLLSGVCHDVCREPPLLPLSSKPLSYSTTNRDDSAQLDIRANGFWGLPQQQAYFDVRMFNPSSHAYRKQELAACYWKHEKEKQRAYGQRVREIEVENAEGVVPAYPHAKLFLLARLNAIMIIYAKRVVKILIIHLKRVVKIIRHRLPA